MPWVICRGNSNQEPVCFTQEKMLKGDPGALGGPFPQHRLNGQLQAGHFQLQFPTEAARIRFLFVSTSLLVALGTFLL